MATLIDAVKERNVDGVRDLLATGANADETDASGRAALYFAAQRGLIEIARCLLNRGARTSLQTNWGSTPLHVAADKGFDDLLRLLTRAQDANANIQNKNGDTALHLAAYRGKLDAVRVLLDAGADVALVNGEGRTAIEDSESNGHYQVADCLKAHLETRYRRAPLGPPPPPAVSPSLGAGPSSLSYYHQQQRIPPYPPYSPLREPFSHWHAHGSAFPRHYDDVSMATTTTTGGVDEIMELRRQCAEKEQLEYKNQALNDALNSQQERIARVDMLERKNSQLIDQLARLRAEMEQRGRGHDDEVVLKKSRLSQVAGALLGDDGTLESSVAKKLAGILLVDVGHLTGIDFKFDIEDMCGKGRLPVVKGDAVEELGKEWEVGVDYELLESKPLNQRPDGSREGACSLIFRIRHFKLGRMILKVMINLVNMHSGGHGSGQSLGNFLAGQFGAEHSVPLQLPRHPNIAEIRHHYDGSTSQFTRYLPYIVPPHMDVRLELATKTTFMAMKEYDTTLQAFADHLRVTNSVPPYGFTETHAFALLAQISSAVHHLLHFGVVHRDIKADNVFLDESGWRAVVADFGMARFLYRSGFESTSKPIQFVEPGQMMAGNARAWAPEIVRYSREGPPPDRDLFLPDLYSKADVYGIGTMMGGLLCGSGAAGGVFPGSISPRLRFVLRGATCDDVEGRLSARQVEVTSAILACELRLWHADGIMALERWRSEELFKMALVDDARTRSVRDAVLRELKCRLLYTSTADEMRSCLISVQSS